MNFEEYLKSKKIDSSAFRVNEPDVWESWKTEFEQISPASFTGQKLYLINPIRRKYTLASPIEESKPAANEKTVSTPVPTQISEQETPKTPASPRIPVAKPVFRPKPKMS